MALKNTVTKKAYQNDVRSKANPTKVTATLYDSTQVSKRPSMKVKSTVEGTK